MIDKERAFAALVRGESSHPPVTDDPSSVIRKRKRRRPRRKEKSTKNLDSKETSFKDVSLPPPPSLCSTASSHPLSLVADYSDSDDNEEFEIPQVIKGTLISCEGEDDIFIDMYNSSNDDDEGSDVTSVQEPQLSNLPHFDSDSDPERLLFFEASTSSDSESAENTKIVQKLLTINDYFCFCTVGQN